MARCFDSAVCTCMRWWRGRVRSLECWPRTAGPAPHRAEPPSPHRTHRLLRDESRRIIFGELILLLLQLFDSRRVDLLDLGQVLLEEGRSLHVSRLAQLPTRPTGGLQQVPDHLRVRGWGVARWVLGVGGGGRSARGQGQGQRSSSLPMAPPDAPCGPCAAPQPPASARPGPRGCRRSRRP